MQMILYRLGLTLSYYIYKNEKIQITKEAKEKIKESKKIEDEYCRDIQIMWSLNSSRILGGLVLSIITTGYINQQKELQMTQNLQ